MLESLTAINFQRHEKRVFDLDPFVTCFVGATDKGKSSIIRLLRWIILNQPRGDEFISWGKEKCIGKLTLDDGRLIVRKIGSCGNVYKLDDAEYRAFGSDVPSDITSLLNVSDTNFQLQLDSPFWLTESPGQVSRQLNAIINLGVIDSTLSNVASEVRKAKSAVEVSEHRLTAARETRESLKWVPDMMQKLNSISEQKDRISAIALKRSRINDLLSRGRLLRDNIRDASSCISDAANAIAIGEKLETISSRRKRIESLVGRIEQARESAEREIPSLASLTLQMQELESHVERRQKLEALISNIENASEKATCQRQSYLSLKQQFTEQMGEYCPLCNQPLKWNHVHQQQNE